MLGLPVAKTPKVCNQDLLVSNVTRAQDMGNDAINLDGGLVKPGNCSGPPIT